MKYNLHDFFKWVKGTKLVELDDIDELEIMSLEPEKEK